MIELPPSAFPNEIDAGMKLRDYFAAKAMQTLLSRRPIFDEYIIKTICKEAYFTAEAMLEVRNKSFLRKERDA